MLTFKDFNKRNELTELSLSDFSASAQSWINKKTGISFFKKPDQKVKDKDTSTSNGDSTSNGEPGGVTQIQKSGERKDYLVNQPPPDPGTSTPPEKVPSNTDYDAMIKMKRDKLSDPSRGVKKAEDRAADQQRAELRTALDRAAEKRARELKISKLDIQKRKDDGGSYKSPDMPPGVEKKMPRQQSIKDYIDNQASTNIDDLSFGKAFAQEFKKKPGGVMTWRGKQYKLARK